MITEDDAREAEQVFKWCEDLRKSPAFAEVVLAEITARKDEAERCGTDVTKSPAERAEHHRAFHLAKELLTLVDRRSTDAQETLRQWSAQHARPFSGLADDSHV